VSVGQAMATQGDKPARAQVEAAAADPNTISYARDRLGALLTATPATPEPAPATPKKK
jgi:hypothetical protein